MLACLRLHVQRQTACLPPGPETINGPLHHNAPLPSRAAQDTTGHVSCTPGWVH